MNTMGETDSLWVYQENHEMEQLGQKLLCTTLELETLKAEAMNEMNKNKEYIKQLIHLLRFAVRERDEARNELHKLLNNIPAGTANSGIAESNSPSDVYPYHSHSSSPVDSLLINDIASPGFNLVCNNQPLLEFDRGSMIIDSIANGKVLPERGRFLQAIREAGPLLQTLLVAGPLPRWRNPPQVQPVQIPPVAISGCNTLLVSKNPSGNGCENLGKRLRLI